MSQLTEDFTCSGLEGLINSWIWNRLDYRFCYIVSHDSGIALNQILSYNLLKQWKYTVSGAKKTKPKNHHQYYNEALIICHKKLMES